MPPTRSTLAALCLAAAPLCAQEFEFAEDQPVVELPLVLLANGNYPGLPCVELGFGGAPRLFFLDTGFNGVGVAPALAKELDLERRGSDLQAGIGGMRSIDLYRAPAVEIGRARFTAPLFYALDLNGFQRGRGRALAGILGGQFFAKAVVTIDYMARRVRFCDPEAFTPPEGAAPQRLDFSIGQPEVWATIDGGRRVRFVLDTGAEGCLVLNPAFVERLGLAARPEHLAESRILGFNGTVASHSCSLAQFAFAGRTFANPAALLMGAVDGISMGSDTRRGGLIGSAMLASLRVTFDYAHRQVFLEGPADAAPAQPVGIFADWDDPAAIVIQEVMQWPGRPTVDLEVGDRLVHVDGAAVTDPTAFYALLRGRPEVVLTVERDGERRDVTWPRIDALPRATAAATAK